jgi:hypothetical protein
MSWTDRVRKDVFIPHRDCELLRDSASNVVGGVDAKSSVEVALSASWLVDTATLVMKKRERTASLHRGPHESTKDRVRDAVLRVESTWSPMLVSELVVSDAVDETLSSKHGTFDVDNFFGVSGFNIFNDNSVRIHSWQANAVSTQQSTRFTNFGGSRKNRGVKLSAICFSLLKGHFFDP